MSGSSWMTDEYVIENQRNNRVPSNTCRICHQRGLTENSSEDMPSNAVPRLPRDSQRRPANVNAETPIIQYIDIGRLRIEVPVEPGIFATVSVSAIAVIYAGFDYFSLRSILLWFMRRFIFSRFD